MSKSNLFYILLQIFPEARTLKASESIAEINSYIIANLNVKNHKKEWIEDHIATKDGHYIDFHDDDTGKIKASFIVASIPKFKQINQK